MQIELTDSEDPGIRAAISARLNAHNAARLGVPGERHTLAVLLRDAGGAVEGGLWGVTAFGWLNLNLAYVPAHRRGTGLGAAMLGAMEADAVALGCIGVRTGSYSFQAPGFYVKRGYTAYARLDDHPPGHHDIALFKRDGLGGGDVGLTVERDPPLAARLDIRTLLLAHNDAHAGPSGFRALSVVMRGPDGAIMGGLAGYTEYGWLVVDQFALPEDSRRGGMGRRMLGDALAEAQARGAIGAKLATASYQARPFYEKMGFSAYGTIGDYQPGGHERYLLAHRFG